MATLWAALQHFGNEDGSLTSDGEPFWLVSKVCGDYDTALAFDDGDGDSDEFKVVGIASESFDSKPDYEAVQRIVYGHLPELSAMPDGGILHVA